MQRRTVAFLTTVIIVGACQQEAQQNDHTVDKAKPVGPPPCETAKLVAIEYSTSSYRCPNPGANGTGKLVADSIDMTMGRGLDDVVADARKAGATVSRGRITTLSLVTEDPSEYGSPFYERRTYMLASKAGRVTGLRACETYQSGLHRRRLSTAMVGAFGAPTSVDGGMTGAGMSWPEGHWFNISGSPNIVRAKVGDAPDAISSGDDDFNRRIFNEVVRAEDRMPGDTEGARSSVAMKYCMTTDELTSIMVPLLESGMQPEDD